MNYKRNVQICGDIIYKILPLYHIFKLIIYYYLQFAAAAEVINNNNDSDGNKNVDYINLDGVNLCTGIDIACNQKRMSRTDEMYRDGSAISH